MCIVYATLYIFWDNCLKGKQENSFFVCVCVIVFQKLEGIKKKMLPDVCFCQKVSR